MSKTRTALAAVVCSALLSGCSLFSGDPEPTPTPTSIPGSSGWPTGQPGWPTEGTPEPSAPTTSTPIQRPTYSPEPDGGSDYGVEPSEGAEEGTDTGAAIHGPIRLPLPEGEWTVTDGAAVGQPDAKMWNSGNVGVFIGPVEAGFNPADLAGEADADVEPLTVPTPAGFKDATAYHVRQPEEDSAIIVVLTDANDSVWVVSINTFEVDEFVAMRDSVRQITHT